MMIPNIKGIVHLKMMLLILFLMKTHIIKLYEYRKKLTYFSIVYQVTLKRRSAAIKKRKEIFKRAEQYVKEYRIKERDEIRLARQVSIIFIYELMQTDDMLWGIITHQPIYQYLGVAEIWWDNYMQMLTDWLHNT